MVGDRRRAAPTSARRAAAASSTSRRGSTISRDLGVNAIQLLPIQEFPTEFSEGYNGVDYFSPEQSYQAASDADLAWYLDKINASLAAFGAEPLTLDAAPARRQPAQVPHRSRAPPRDRRDLRPRLQSRRRRVRRQSLYFYDRLANGNQNDSLYFTDQGWAGGLVFAFWNANVRQFLIDNASAFLKEYRIDGIRYDEVRVISNNRPGGVELCRDMTSTLRFIRPSRSRSPNTGTGTAPFPVTPAPAGLGFDAALGDALSRFGARRFWRRRPAGRAPSFSSIRSRPGFIRPPATTRHGGVVQCLENHDLDL